MTPEPTMETKIIPIGEYVDGYGEVEMIGLTGGERYYWFRLNGTISMMPASLVDQNTFRKEECAKLIRSLAQPKMEQAQ
jgi:hypothetical protein